MKRSAKILIALLVLLLAQSAFALEAERRAQAREQIRSVKIWEMTRDLGLSEQQARMFFPAEEEHEREKERLRHERKTIETEMEARLSEGRQDDRQLLVYLERIKQVDETLAVHEREFERKLSRILRPEQRARYELFEKRFEARLRQLIKEIQRGEIPEGAQRAPQYRDSDRERHEKNDPNGRQSKEKSPSEDDKPRGKRG
jgi:hypothetical protein